MTDLRGSGLTTDDIVNYAAAANEDPAEVDEEQPLQTELLARGEQKREPSPPSSVQHGEGEHQMKGSLAEVNPIGPANAQGKVERVRSVHEHQHGRANMGVPAHSLVRPGVNEHTDLAIANDTRVAGGREVGGSTLNAPDPEGIIAEEAADITAQLVEATDVSDADITLAKPVDMELPEFTDRVSLFDEDGNLRSDEDRQADLDEKNEAEEIDLPETEIAERDEVEEFDATSIVETSPEALAKAQEERSEEEAEEQAEETGVDLDDEEADDAEASERPANSANKPEWVDYVVANFEVTREEAEGQTKEQLIETYG